MPFVISGITVGDSIILKKQLSSCAGTFEKGSLVKITGVGDRGYSISDEEGNTMCEVGFDIGEKVAR